MTKNDFEKLGGTSNIAKVCGVGSSAVSMWIKRGKIPYKRAKLILAYAAKIGIYWTVEYVMGEE